VGTGPPVPRMPPRTTALPKKRKAQNPEECPGLLGLCEEGESNPHGC
jgi:hypothetical protein